eukprot:TRINITY_DN15284_c0_g1_i2.p1 TRINITY_DN15284_c0_g1~~TRINITY_DN15284_c0_g1_i2.p1  ORF type:complete len:303 (-),score=67.62 TRINITY_DN15284_c0_g1_i2:134-1042(-)
MRNTEKAIAGQRFATEVRQDLFKLLLESSDDLEGYTSIVTRLGDPYLKSTGPDVAAVIVQCCVQEESFNVFYCRLLLRFLLSADRKSSGHNDGAASRAAGISNLQIGEELTASEAIGATFNRFFKKALQYALWDKFKQLRVGTLGSPSSSGVDIVALTNLGFLLTFLLGQGVFGLAVLRGLDLDDRIDRNTGLFTRILVLRLSCELSPERLTGLFFGADLSASEDKAHDMNIDTKPLRKTLRKFVASYFLDEIELKKWLPLLQEVVAHRTPFQNVVTQDVSALAQLKKRFIVVERALKEGIA